MERTWTFAMFIVRADVRVSTGLFSTLSVWFASGRPMAAYITCAPLFGADKWAFGESGWDVCPSMVTLSGALSGSR